MRSRILVLLAVVGAVGALALAGVAAADHPGGGGTPLGATLTGAAEAPGPGDPDGSGTILLRLNSGQQEICFDAETADIATIVGAHIHRAPAGAAGPIVVHLTGQFPAGCVFAPRELIKAIRKNPENYYVNVHTVGFPAGAIRGQLGHVAPGQAKRD